MNTLHNGIDKHGNDIYSQEKILVDMDGALAVRMGSFMLQGSCVIRCQVMF